MTVLFWMPSQAWHDRLVSNDSDTLVSVGTYGSSLAKNDKALYNPLIR